MPKISAWPPAADALGDGHDPGGGHRRARLFSPGGQRRDGRGVCLLGHHGRVAGLRPLGELADLGHRDAARGARPRDSHLHRLQPRLDGVRGLPDVGLHARREQVMIAPVLPTTAYALALFLLLGYQRFHPSGVFHPLNDPDRDFPSLYHPKFVARRRAQQRQKQLERFQLQQQQQQQQQQSQRLLGEAEAAGEELAKSEEAAAVVPVVRLAVEVEEGEGKGIAVARA